MKYEITECDSWIGSYVTCWEELDPSGIEQAEATSAAGLMVLRRYPDPNDGNAWLRFCHGSRTYDIFFEPCPTRLGLVRIARKYVKEQLAKES